MKLMDDFQLWRYERKWTLNGHVRIVSKTNMKPSPLRVRGGQKFDRIPSVDTENTKRTKNKLAFVSFVSAL